MTRTLLITLAALALGCAPTEPASDAASADDKARAEANRQCEHPYPCGEHWPAGLTGPFEREEEIRHVWLTVPSDYDDPSQGTIQLEGWIGLPKVPAGVKVPVAVASSPYHRVCAPRAAVCVSDPGDEGWWSDTGTTAGRNGLATAYSGTPLEAWGVPPIELVRNGYAAAFFSVRGTSNSGGCFEMFGRNEQRDQAAIVEYLASQEWSNGRVGMGGLSYEAATAWEAAIFNPEPLKTIVTSGIVSDWYTFTHTPQGALNPQTNWYMPVWITETVLLPALGGDPVNDFAPQAAIMASQFCEDARTVIVGPQIEAVNDYRYPEYYVERRLIDRFDEVRAAVLLAQGFADVTAHRMQESAVWQVARKAPKWQLEGQWGHTFPMESVATLPDGVKWPDSLMSWLDYWLKGVGPVPAGVGHVDYQDDARNWHRSTAWPPAEAQEEVLYLAGRELSGTPGSGARTFRSMPPAITNDIGGAEYSPVGPFATFPFNTYPVLCPETEPTDAEWVTYWSEPLAGPARVAGNPFAYLRMTSDQPGGLVGVHVLELPADFDCTDAAQASKVQVLGYGAADLRFHAGNLTPINFPICSLLDASCAPSNVRIDLFDDADDLAAGSRLAVVVSFGEALPLGFGYYGGTYFPNITVHSDGGALASQVVLPVVEGTLGGSKPRIEYPPRPFVPAKK